MPLPNLIAVCEQKHLTSASSRSKHSSDRRQVLRFPANRLPLGCVFDVDSNFNLPSNLFGSGRPRSIRPNILVYELVGTCRPKGNSSNSPGPFALTRCGLFTARNSTAAGHLGPKVGRSVANLTWCRWGLDPALFGENCAPGRNVPLGTTV